MKDSPKHLVDIIANILLAFLLKENVPVAEAEELVDKVREKKMAELFENMEPMDIQAERRNTEKERQRAEKAEEDLEKAICAFVEVCQEFSMTRETTILKIMEKFEVSEDVAAEMVGKYWEE